MRPWFLVLMLSIAACSSGATSDVAADTDGNETSRPVRATSTNDETNDETIDDTAGPDEVVTPEGFGSVAATVTTDSGEVCEVCLWLADTNDLRRRGLMFVTDLGGADGMAFLYPSPHTGTFWMRNTVTPLSIAFFAPDGAYLDAFDMAPCTAEPCLQYATPPDFTVAIEVFQGDLDEVGIGPGSRLDLSDLPCEPDA